MSVGGPVFELPRKIEKLLASLATYYGKQNKVEIQKLLVNARYHVQEEHSYDNWNGGTYGHAIHFQVPAIIYGEILDSLQEVSQKIREDINRIGNVENEFIDAVFLEVQNDPALESWREKSGVLLHPAITKEQVSEEQLNRIWIAGYFRLFISHKAAYKNDASQLKEAMDYYGVSCFVAHEDIEPTKEWQNEIENALFSMDALLALMTKDFSDSRWTDQEIGVAIGRQVPIIPVRLGKDPYGFIGKFQALSGVSKTPKAIAKEIYDLLWARSDIKERLVDSLLVRFSSAVNFQQANDLVKYIEAIETPSPEIIKRIEAAPENNSQVRDAFSVKAALPRILKKLRRGREGI